MASVGEVYGVGAGGPYSSRHGGAVYPVLAAYGGVFVAGSLAWAMALDGFRPDRWDVIGALICLAGVAVIMYAPRAH